MVGRYAQILQGLHVDFGPIARVGFPAIARMVLRQIPHQRVAVDLGHHRGGGETEGAGEKTSGTKEEKQKYKECFCYGYCDSGCAASSRYY